VGTETLRKEEKEEKVVFESKVKWGSRSLFRGSSSKETSKVDLQWEVKMRKLKEVEVGDMGYCNSGRKIEGSIGGFWKECKERLV